MVMVNPMLKSIFVNTGWNIIGLVLPLFAAVLAIPVLISNIGTDRFSMLSLIWVAIGYFSLFDLGLGRAVTKLVSELDLQQGVLEMQSLCVTSLCMAGVAGLVGCGLVLFVFWGAGIQNYLPINMLVEVRNSFYWVGLCIPVIVCTAVLKGVLEGLQRFRVLNLIRGPLGAIFFLLPAGASFWDASLTMAVAMSVMARLLMLCAHYLPCRVFLVWKQQMLSWVWIRPLLGFGGWFTVSNLVGPVIVYMDRFVLAAVVPFSNIAYYTAPFELVSKVLNIPVAVTSALFPVINKLQANGNESGFKLKSKVQWLVFAGMAVVVLVGWGLANWFLKIWLGADFAEHSTPVMQWLLVGFGLNALAQVTYVSLQSQSQTRVVAWLHLLELPIYGVLLWVLISALGMLGAAIAWATRSCLDWLALEYLLHRSRHRVA